MSFPCVALGECCDIVGGSTPRTLEPALWGGDVMWATPKDLSGLNARYISKTARSITRRGLQSCGAKILPVGSVLLSSRAPIGLVAINTVPMATNQGFKSIVPHPDKVDAGYLAYWLGRNCDYLQNLGSGATFKEISKAVVYRIQIPLPSLDTQRWIARILDAMDALRSKRRESLSRLESLTESIFAEMFGDILTNPRGWPVGPVSDFAMSMVGGRSFAGIDDKQGTVRYRVLKVSSVTSNQFRPSESRPVPSEYEPPEQHVVRDGDLLFTRANTTELVGAVALVRSPPPDMLLPDKIWRFVWRDAEAVSPEFVWQLFRSREVRQEVSKRATGTSGSMKNISAKKLLAIPIIQPPIADQIRFAECLQRVLALGTKIEDGLDRLDALFASLQDRAFKGELRDA